MAQLDTGVPTGARVTINGFPLMSLTAPAVLLLVVVAILRGMLVPRRTYDDMRTFLTADRDQWRDAHRFSEVAREMQERQINELLEHARTTDAFIRAIPRAADQSSKPAERRHR